MSGKKHKSFRKIVIWSVAAAGVAIMAILGWLTFTEWLPSSKEISDIPSPTSTDITTNTPSPNPSLPANATSQPLDNTVPPTPEPNTDSTPGPTASPTNVPEITATPTPEPTPVTSEVPVVSYEPPPPSYSPSAEPIENYGFNLETIIIIENQYIKDGLNNTLAEMGYPRKDEITIADILKLESLIVIPSDAEFDESELNCCRDSLNNFTVIHNDYPWKMDFLIYAKNLKVFYCFNNVVKKVNAISNLEKLVYVGFPECNITSLDFIKNLDSLLGINFNYNKLTTFLPIIDLENLRSIKLIENDLFNINPLSDATYEYINDLWLWGNNITDISPITSMVNLKWLAIGNNDIDDLTPLLSLDSLNELYIDANQSQEHADVLNNIKNQGCNIVIFGR